MTAWCILFLGFQACASATELVQEMPKPGRESDEAFLDDFQRRCFQYFLEQAEPSTGLVADRAMADGSGKFDIASIAATGFGLAALCIGDERGWIESDQAYQRVLTTLRFIWEKLPNEHGFYYHFVDNKTGERVWNCELSSIDTGLLLAGVLTAGQYYKGTEVEELATKIYDRVDWPWMRGGGKTLTMGWTPENGFLNATWDGYSEHTIIYLMGLGSNTHPLPPEAWKIWKREPVIAYDELTFLACPPLFTHQFSHAFVDYRGKRDDFANYYRNSVLATRAHRRMCIKLAKRFPHYSEDLWGITASDYAGGYTAWGGPPATENIDGTVVPCAAAGSVPFLPDEAIHTLRYMKETYGDRVWKRYGFVDAFNPQTGYTADQVIGIDVGISLLMIENYRSGFVWKYFMANPEVQRAMDLAGFRPEGEVKNENSSVYGLESIPSERLGADWNKGDRTARVRPMSNGWERADWHAMTAENSREKGQPRKDNEVSARFAFAWNKQSLYVVVRVVDGQVVNTSNPDRLYKQDCVELYINPQNDGMVWGSDKDFQFGFAVTDKVWEWFGARQDQIEQTVKQTDDGYEVRAAIPWRVLGVTPTVGLKMQASVAVKSVSAQGNSSIKLNWRFKEMSERIRLGELVLE
jgi:hypothetical protein